MKHWCGLLMGKLMTFITTTVRVFDHPVINSVCFVRVLSFPLERVAALLAKMYLTWIEEVLLLLLASSRRLLAASGLLSSMDPICFMESYRVSEYDIGSGIEYDHKEYSTQVDFSH